MVIPGRQDRGGGGEAIESGRCDSSAYSLYAQSPTFLLLISFGYRPAIKIHAANNLHLILN